ncbi:unnamed protein product [Urochloa humidicola]
MRGSRSMMCKMMVAIFLSFAILLFASPAQCGRLHQLREARSIMVTNTSTDTTIMIHPNTDEDKPCDLVFCTKWSDCFNGQRGTLDICYCCDADPKRPCYATRGECGAHCPLCKT